LQNQIQLNLFVLNVWGMPEVLGSQDKPVRMNAIGRLVSHGQYDVYVFSELWLKSDHQIIKSWIPEGFSMTEYGDFSLPSCDGILSPWDCSGLAIVSRFPFLETDFLPFAETGDWQSLDGEFWAQKGAGRLKIEPIEGFSTDIIVTHTCADGPTYTNAYYRTKQAEQLVKHIEASEAEFIIVAGDLNTDPLKEEEAFAVLERSLVNSFQDFETTSTEWLKPRRATYANPENSYSCMNEPAVYDYVWHKGNKGNRIWTSYLDVPILKTLKNGEENEDPLTISLSDHEAVIANLVLWKKRSQPV